MWSLAIVQMANRVAVPLLVLMGLAEIGMAVGLIPMSLLWGFGALQGSAVAIIGALILISMASIIDKRASQPPSKWIRLGAWLVTAILVAMVVSNFSSDYFLERWILGIVNIVAAICCGIVASSTPSMLMEPVYEEITATDTEEQ